MLVQDKQSLGLRIVMIAIKEEELPEFDMDRDYQQLWTKRMAEIAGPHLTASERVVSFREFAWAAMQKKTTPSELPCPNCRAPLHWHLLEGSEE